MKKTMMFVPVADTLVQCHGTANWRSAIAYNEQNGWYGSTIHDNEAEEVCKVFFVGCSDKREILPIVAKNLGSEFAEVVANSALHRQASQEMLDAFRERNWHYMSVFLSEVIYLDYFID